MRVYVKPSVNNVGSLQELTQSEIYKSSGVGDVIHIAGLPPIPVPGKGVTGFS